MNYNYSFSGSDCHTFITFMEPAYLTGWIKLDNLSTISVSVHEQRSQVRRLGHAGVVGFAGSVRTIAGSIIMTIINENPFYDLIKGAKLQEGFVNRVSKTETGTIKDLRLPYNYGTPNMNYEFTRTNNTSGSKYSIPNITTLPPTKIRMRFVSEYHSNNNAQYASVNKNTEKNGDREVERIMELHNVVFISENIVTSVNNMVTELVIQFIASDFVEFTKEKNTKEIIQGVKIEADQIESQEEEAEANPNQTQASSNSNVLNATTPPLDSATQTQTAVNNPQNATPKTESTEQQTQPKETQSTDAKPQTGLDIAYKEILQSRKVKDYYKNNILKGEPNNIKKIAEYINPVSEKYIKKRLQQLAFDNNQNATNKTNEVLFGKNYNSLPESILGKKLDDYEKNASSLNEFFNTGKFSSNNSHNELAALNLLGEIMVSSNKFSDALSIATDGNSNVLTDFYNNEGVMLLKQGYGNSIRNQVDLFDKPESEYLNELKLNQNHLYDGTDYQTNKYLESTRGLMNYLNRLDPNNKLPLLTQYKQKLNEEYSRYYKEIKNGI